MIPSCTQEQKTDCHMNSHVTPIRNIRGMPFTQLSSDPKHIEITSSRHHLRAERKILNQNKKMLFDEGLESTFSGQFTSSTRLVQLNFSVIPHQRSTTISFKTYTPDLLSVRVFLYQNTPRIWGHAASVCWHWTQDWRVQVRALTKAWMHISEVYRDDHVAMFLCNFYKTYHSQR